LSKHSTPTAPSYLRTIGLILLYWFLIFWIQRIFFIVFFWRSFSQYPFSEIASTFYHGFKLDLSASCYLSVIPVLALTVQQAIRPNFFKRFLFLYSILLLPVIGFISVFDMGIYHDWQIHLNYRAISYLRFVKEAAAFSDSRVNLILTIIMIVDISLGIALLILLFRKARFRYPWNRRTAIPGTLLHVAAFPLLFVGMRCGFQLIPINESAAYFSPARILNDAAVNITWNAVKKFSDNREALHRNPYTFMPDDEAAAVLRYCYAPKGDSVISLLTTNRPNIVLFVLESFTADLIESLDGDPGVTPNLDTLIQKGLLFTRIYAQGHRTDQGLASIFSGWPATPDFSIIMQPEKYHGLNFFPQSLNRAGYHCSFFYGGEIEFANMKAFMLEAGISDLHDKGEFTDEQMSAKWGAHDEFVMDNQLQKSNELTEPFFSVILSLSSHEPFDVPMKTRFPGNDPPARLRNSAYYTDRCIGNYMRKAKNEPWFANTLFIFVADHSHVFPRNRKTEEPARFHIPLIFYGEVIRPEFKAKELNQVGMQVDLPATLLAQLGIPHSEFTWSNDLMNFYRHDFAYYTFDSGLGWVENELSLYHYFKTNDTHYEGRPEDSTLMLKQALSFVQILYGDYLAY
jgi:phosphoglycerol transferase MdoB-like AlkP superfamily enzyme